MLRLPRNTILVFTHAGLGNRMLAIGTAIELGRSIGKDVHILWGSIKGGGNSAGCHFKDLFEISDGLKVIEQYWWHSPKLLLDRSAQDRPATSPDRLEFRRYERLGSPRERDVRIERDFRANWRPLPDWRRRLHARIKALLSRRYWGIDAVLWVMFRGYFDPAEADKLRDRRCIYVEAGHQFFPRPFEFGQAWDHLVPIKPIRDEVSSIASRFGRRTVGVHIRRGDTVDMPARFSPTERFVRLMEDEIARDDGVRFYLATDSEQELAALTARFGDRIIAQATAHRAKRSDVAGLRAALVDMYTLARTNKIIASFNSSFSYLAASIGQTEYHAVDAQESEP